MQEDMPDDVPQIVREAFEQVDCPWASISNILTNEGEPFAVNGDTVEEQVAATIKNLEELRDQAAEVIEFLKGGDTCAKS
jgi:hypothetical protein